MDRCWWSRCQANDGLGATNARVVRGVAMRVRRRFRAATEDMWKGGGGAATRRDGVDDVRVPCLALRAACITVLVQARDRAGRMRAAKPGEAR